MKSASILVLLKLEIYGSHGVLDSLWVILAH